PAATTSSVPSCVRTIPVGSGSTGIPRTTVTSPSPRRSTATPFGDRGFALIRGTKQEQPSFERMGSNGCPGTSTNASESAMAWLQPRGLAVPWADTRGASATPAASAADRRPVASETQVRLRFTGGPPELLLGRCDAPPLGARG